MAEVIRYPTEYKVLTPRPYISQRAASPPTIEVTPADNNKPDNVWDRLSKRKQDICIYGTLFVIFFIGICLVIICSVLLGTGVPNRSSGGNAGKAFGIGLGCVMVICSIVIFLLVYCRRPRKYQRALITRQPEPKRPVQIIREVPKEQPKVLMVKEPVKQPLIVQRPVVVQQTIPAQPRPFTILADQPTTIVSTNAQPSYVVTSPLSTRSTPVVLFKKK